MRDAPAPHPGLLSLACPRESSQREGPPGWREYSRASAVPGPGADLTRHPASKIMRGHPVRAPFTAPCGNLAVRGRAIRGPKQSTHLRPVLLVPFGVRRALGARFKLIADSLFS